jgi:hypothetical protein
MDTMPARGSQWLVNFDLAVLLAADVELDLKAIMAVMV